jgi:hypothetical protein
MVNVPTSIIFADGTEVKLKQFEFVKYPRILPMFRKTANILDSMHDIAVSDTSVFPALFDDEDNFIG